MLCRRQLVVLAHIVHARKLARRRRCLVGGLTAAGLAWKAGLWVGSPSVQWCHLLSPSLVGLCVEGLRGEALGYSRVWLVAGLVAVALVSAHCFRICWVHICGPASTVWEGHSPLNLATPELVRKCRILGSIPDLRNHNLLFNQVFRWFLSTLSLWRASFRIQRTRNRTVENKVRGVCLWERDCEDAFHLVRLSHFTFSVYYRFNEIEFTDHIFRSLKSPMKGFFSIFPDLCNQHSQF